MFVYLQLIEQACKMPHKDKDKVKDKDKYKVKEVDNLFPRQWLKRNICMQIDSLVDVPEEICDLNPQVAFDNILTLSKHSTN